MTERQEPSPQPVVDVVGVIGDIVGNCGGLGFRTREAPEPEVGTGRVFDDRRDLYAVEKLVIFVVDLVIKVSQNGL